MDELANGEEPAVLSGEPSGDGVQAAPLGARRATLAHVGSCGGKAYRKPPGPAGRDVGQRGPPAADTMSNLLAGIVVAQEKGLR